MDNVRNITGDPVAGLDADEFLRHGRPRIVYGVALAENKNQESGVRNQGSGI